jgi:hypothetical protein
MDGPPTGLYISPAPSAGWQSGYAEDCKSSYGGSIPPPASTRSTGRKERSLRRRAFLSLLCGQARGPHLYGAVARASPPSGRDQQRDLDTLTSLCPPNIEWHFRFVGLHAGRPDLLDELVDLIDGDQGELAASDLEKTLDKLRLFHRVPAVHAPHVSAIRAIPAQTRG